MKDEILKVTADILSNVPMVTFEYMRTTGDLFPIAEVISYEGNERDIMDSLTNAIELRREMDQAQHLIWKMHRQVSIRALCKILKTSREQRFVNLLAKYGFIVTEGNYQNDINAISTANEIITWRVIIPEILSDEVDINIRFDHLKRLLNVDFGDDITALEFLEHESAAIKMANEKYFTNSN